MRRLTDGASPAFALGLIGALFITFMIMSPIVSAGDVLDSDKDGIPDDEDNCPTTFNPDQEDMDQVATLVDDFETGETGDWSFEYSNDGLQAGSNGAGDWATEIVEGLDALDGNYSCRLHALADAHANPYLIFASVSQELDVTDQLEVSIAFDTITGVGGTGGSYFEIAVIDPDDSARMVRYRYCATGSPGGDYEITVAESTSEVLVVDMDADFTDKYGDSLTTAIVRLTAHADYSETGPGLRETDVRIDTVTTVTLEPDGVGDACDNCPGTSNPDQADSESAVTMVEDFESGNLDSWSFEYSNDGLQSGSISPGDWESEIVDGADAMDDAYSCRLHALADAHVSPYLMNASISREVSVMDLLEVSIAFDTITGVGGTGGSYFEIAIIDPDDSARLVRYRYCATGSPGGDYEITVAESTSEVLVVDMDADFTDKYGDSIPTAIVRLTAHADYSEAGPGLRETDVRIDSVTTVALDPDGVGDACDNCPGSYNPDQIDEDLQITLAEDFESGDLDDMSFEYSTNGLQSGSVAAGDWESDIVDSLDALDDDFSCRLHATADVSTPPYNVVAAISREFDVADRLKVSVAFDTISGTGGTGGSYFEIAVVDPDDSARAVIYRYSETGDQGGDYQITVAESTSEVLVVDMDADFTDKYGDSLTTAVVRFKVYADYAESGSGLRETDVRIDSVFTGVLAPDGVGDECDDCIEYEDITECDPHFLRGDVDANGSVFPIIDALFLLEYGFTGGATPPCLDAADVDGNDSVFPIIDALYLLEYGFNSGPLPPSPGPSICGIDDTPDDSISCDAPVCP